MTSRFPDPRNYKDDAEFRQAQTTALEKFAEKMDDSLYGVTGEIRGWAGDLDKLPDGWLKCLGGTITAEAYPTLYKLTSGTLPNYAALGNGKWMIKT